MNSYLIWVIFKFSDSQKPATHSSMSQPAANRIVKTVRDVTLMSDQSMHLSKWIPALEQVTVMHLILIRGTCPSGMQWHSAKWYPTLQNGWYILTLNTRVCWSRLQHTQVCSSWLRHTGSMQVVWQSTCKQGGLKDWWTERLINGI